MTVEDARAGVLVLAHHTGWSLAEISGLEVGEFIDWLNSMPKHHT